MHTANVIQGFFPNGMIRMKPIQCMAAPATRQTAGGIAVQVPSALAPPARAAGMPLPQAVLQKMEALFGTRFADVRVHVGSAPANIGALAFTQGSNIYFAPGQYDPHASRGQQTLAHELAHVVQQRSGRVRNPFGAGVAVVQDRSLEMEADRMALRSAAQRIPVQAAQPGIAQRQTRIVQRCSSCGNPACNSGSICARALVAKAAAKKWHLYPRAVASMNGVLTRYNVALPPERGEAIITNMNRIEAGEISMPTAHFGEARGFLKDLFFAKNVKARDRVVFGAGVFANIIAAGVAGALERQKMLGVGPLVQRPSTRQ